ncbi:hypothetical protein [Streptomyces sp. NPDC056049]|uniref:hypothetical protein n=1 Tax=Streptomyces sp. NPDC056049 TaxID=3345693 RepID=UPI0035DE1258
MGVFGAALVFLVGCGSRTVGTATGVEATGAAAEGGATGGAVAAPAWTLSAPIRIDGVRTTDGGRSLVVGAEVPDGPVDVDCVRDLRGALDTVEHGTVYVSVTYESRSQDREAGCTGTRRVEAKVDLGEPLGSRRVMVNSWNVYTPAGATPPALRPCDENGCDPTPPRCTPSSYRQAVDDTDIPKHTNWDERGCDETWLVLDLSTRMGPACGDAGDGCASGSITQRWFYRAEPSGWQAVAMNGEAGCTGIREVLPELPEHLCASLPRLGRG